MSADNSTQKAGKNSSYSALNVVWGITAGVQFTIAASAVPGFMMGDNPLAGPTMVLCGAGAGLSLIWAFRPSLESPVTGDKKDAGSPPPQLNT